MAYLAGANIDTDRIIPAKYVVASTNFEGLEQWVFADDRLAWRNEGRTHPFDGRSSGEGIILIVEDNFGCGSSREHAPQALMRWGVRAIVGISFGEIFRRNCDQIGLLCCSLPPKWLTDHRATLQMDLGRIRLDIQRCEIIFKDLVAPIGLSPRLREQLLAGNPDILTQLMLENEATVHVESRLPYLNHWATAH